MSQDISATIHRRNGAQASCEPCRTGKIRCNHRLPVCGRCQRRGWQSKCWYHPAPLTRARGTSPVPGAVSIYTLGHTASNTPPQSISHLQDSQATHALRVSPVHPNSPSYNLYPGRVPHFDASDGRTRDEEVKTVAEILTHMCHLDLIERLFEGYYAVSHAALVPGALIRPAITALQKTFANTAFHSSPVVNDVAFIVLANKTIRSTSVEIEINPSIDAATFCALHTGENLRLETVGLVYTIAARSCLLGLARDDEDHGKFLKTMFRCGETCLRLAREIAPQTNDAIVWLTYENLLFTMVTQGDSSPGVWRRLAELSSEVYALGIHREDMITAQTPGFLAECRRKTFAIVYQVDKLIATLFDRPPRVLRRHSDCKLPLDLDDDELLADEATLDQARSKLTEEGWNSEGKYFKTTWARLRYILGVFREEILEHQFHLRTPENNDKLKEISTRCHQTWRSLPSHLRYSHGCWNFGLSPTVCLMLTVVHLSYLQLDFQIHRILKKTEPESSQALLDVAADILTTVLQLGSSRDRAVFLRHDDFPFIALNYGLPSAAILTSALQNISRTGINRLPSNKSLSTLIRDLNVFVSQLDSIHCPDEANHLLCKQAAQTISMRRRRAAGSGSNNGSHSPSSNPRINYDNNLESTGLNASGSMEPMESGGPDLTNWLKTVDWSGFGTEWGSL